MILRLNVKYRLCTRRAAKTLGVSSEFVRHMARTFFSSYLFSSLYFPILGYVMLLVYMAEYDFFSYDLASTSFFAAILFMQAAIAGLMVATFGLFSAPLCWYANKKGYKIGFKEYWPFIVMNLVSWSVIGLNFALAWPNITFVVSMLAICVVIAAFFYANFFTGNVKVKILAIGGLLVFTVGGSFFAPNVTSGVFSNGLRVFGVGGNIPVVIRDKASPNGFEASLVLVSPSTVFYTVEGEPGFVPISKLLRVERRTN